MLRLPGIDPFTFRCPTPAEAFVTLSQEREVGYTITLAAQYSYGDFGTFLPADHIKKTSLTAGSSEQQHQWDRRKYVLEMHPRFTG